ncbi:MAG: ferritin-like domain-containing protein [Pseudomonadota bacterium]
MSPQQTLYDLLLETDAQTKCAFTKNLEYDVAWKKHPAPLRHPQRIECPGYPEQLTLVAPRELKKRGLQSQEGRNIFIHAIAHIEFNAINLAFDAIYRFSDMPTSFYQDWLRVAKDEARHFQLLNDYLNAHDCGYGDYPAHNGLWEMALNTAHDVTARMALVPRVLEARGLDVTPNMKKRFINAGDHEAAQILETIYQDEIAHVEIGSKWFRYCCEERSLPAKETFFNLINKHLHGTLKGPFNLSARLLAGFEEEELERLQRDF